MIPTPSFFNTSLYIFFGTISSIILFVFNLYQVSQYQPPLCARFTWLQSRIAAIPRIKNTILGKCGFWTCCESLLFSYVQYGFIGLLNSSFGSWVGTGGNYFGILSLLPPAFVLFCLILGVDPLKKADLLVPAYPLALVFSKIACFCAGCCRGFACSWGLFNHTSGLCEFPTQLLEAAVALILFFVLLRLRGKVKTGTMFPIYVILFSATRFFTEFTRCEENVLGFLKIYHLCCIGGLIYGFALLMLIRKYGDRISAFFDRKSA